MCPAATRYGVSTFQLALVNTPAINDNCDNLMPNQTVCLGIEGQDCTKVYTVVEGDTCNWITEMYGMDLDTLYANNPQINDECTNAYIGEVLCVDTEVFDYPDFNQTAFDVSGREPRAKRAARAASRRWRPVKVEGDKVDGG